MKRLSHKTCLLASSLAFVLGTSTALQAQDNNQRQNQTQSQQSSDIKQQRKEAEQKARPEVEQQRQQAEQRARNSLDKDAVTAVDETAKAVKALSDNHPDQALAAIERATGKINVLTARNPAAAMIPVSVEVEAIESAPMDVKEIRRRGDAAAVAVGNRDYPAARVLLAALQDELRVRTHSLPLGSYPAALQEAARLIDQKKTKEASDVLLMALNTLVVVEQVAPLPVLVAKSEIEAAEKLRDNDKQTAETHLKAARQELRRARELGYASKDPEYASLEKQISNLEREVRGRGDTSSLFANLKQRVDSFFHRQSESKRS